MKSKTSVYNTLLIFFVLVIISACFQSTIEKTASPIPNNKPISSEGIKTPDDIRAAKSKQIVEIVESLEPGGWKIVEHVLEFTPENLYEHINGNAELYLSYDVVRLTFASFLNPENANEFIDVFLYNMGSPTNAFGIFSIERYEGEPPVDLGRIAYRSSGSYFIWKGQYYIQILASDDTEKLRQIGLDMAAKASYALDDSGERVWGLTAFPRDNLVPESIKFFLVNAMGLNFMKNIYTADFEKNGIRLKVFITKQPSLESVQTLISQYADYVQKYGKEVERLAMEDTELMACDMGGHFDVIFHKGHLVGGVLSVKDRAVALKEAIDFRNQISEENL